MTFIDAAGVHTGAAARRGVMYCYAVALLLGSGSRGWLNQRSFSDWWRTGSSWIRRLELLQQYWEIGRVLPWRRLTWEALVAKGGRLLALPDVGGVSR